MPKSIVIIIVLITMLIVSNGKMNQLREERDQARHELIIIIPQIQKRMEKIETEMIQREIELKYEHRNMQEMPPNWPIYLEK